jgi:peptide/nickel transport system substrate-binding protein
MREIVFCLILLITFSCKKETSNYTDNQVFRYNEHANVSSLDPAFSKKKAEIWITHQLYNGLVQLDDDLNTKPDIAKHWTFNNDGKTIDFTLRNDVYFHKHYLFGKDSTRTVTAHDFEYSFNRLLDKQVASPGKWVLNNVANFKALNDSVFQINLKQAFPPFLGLLTMKYCSVVPKEIVDFYRTEFRSHPIGTGPFYFKLWVENTKLVFRKNTHYYEIENGNQLPYLEAIAVTFLPDKQSEFLQFIQGNLDILSSLDPSYKDDILTSDGQLQEKYTKQIKMQTGPYLNTEYLGFYADVNANYPSANINIRKAVNYGFDRKKMIKFLRNGVGTPAINGFVPKGLPSFNNVKGYDYNPEKAKALIQQYKDETGDQQPEITLSTNSQYLDLCEFIQQELSELGLSVKVDVMPPPVLRQAKSKGELPVFRASWIADYPDAENYLSLFYSKNFVPNGPNYTHFKSAVFDKLYETSIATVNHSTRHKLYQKMDSIVLQNAPIVPLYYDQVTLFSQKNITGLTINAISILNLKRVKKD